MCYRMFISFRSTDSATLITLILYKNNVPGTTDTASQYGEMTNGNGF